MSESLIDALHELLNAPEISEQPTSLRRVATAKIPSLKPSKVKTERDWKCAFLLPDAQIGMMQYEDGSDIIFQDTKAISVAFQIMAAVHKEYGIDVVINLGDTMDLPQFGKYAQLNSYANTANKTLKMGHDYLAAQRALAPSAEIVMLEGNHECRMEKYVKSMAPNISNVRRVGADEFPVNSLPYLMALDDLNVTYVGGYPASKYYLNQYLIAVHGNKARSNGSTAYQYINNNPMQTVLFGHSHRFEMAYKTHDTKEGPVQNGAFSPGCLSRVDGVVPSVNGGVNLDEKPVTHWENWQQGCGVVWYKETGEFTIEPIHIMNGWAVYGGKEFRAK